jgi:hypothetical protein
VNVSRSFCRAASNELAEVRHVVNKRADATVEPHRSDDATA